jgi:hypothetical protein
MATQDSELLDQLTLESVPNRARAFVADLGRAMSFRQGQSMGEGVRCRLQYSIIGQLVFSPRSIECREQHADGRT